jgi:toxin HigB-1
MISPSRPLACNQLVDTCRPSGYTCAMIRSFKYKALTELWRTGPPARGIDKRMQDRIIRLLDRLDVAAKPDDMSFAGTKFHALRGPKPKRYTVHVNGPWCITFEFKDGDAIEVDLEQYH